MIWLLCLFQQILNYSTSASGKEFVNRLSNITIQSTLFVPENDGLYNNQVTRTSPILLLIFVAIRSKFKVKCRINFGLKM